MAALEHSRTWFQKIGMIKVHFLNRISSYIQADLDLMVTFLPLHIATPPPLTSLGCEVS